MNTAAATTPDLPSADATQAPGPTDLTARSRLSAAYELTKPRITRMVAVTAGVGFALAAIDQSWQTSDLAIRGLGCIVGTAISASGANALNQWWERARDARMPRTAGRPLPQGRLSPAPAAAVGLACSVIGVAVLLATCGPVAAAISALTILLYVLCYTPLKPLTTLNTIVGAVPGALPPLIGWVAAGAGNQLLGPSTAAPLFNIGGWLLFLLMFVWQIPHVLALAWVYKDDYAQGGYRMLPIVDPSGERTARTMLVWSIAFVPVSMAPALLLPDRLGWVTGIVAGASGIAFVRCCWKVWKARTRDAARKAFIASVIHLPVLLLAMLADAVLLAIIR